LIALLYPITLYYWLTATKARRASRLFLRRCYGREPRWHESYRHLLTFAIVATDRIFFMAGHSHKFNVEVHGSELFTETLRNGGILATTHMGSFDALRVMGRKTLSQPLRVLLDVQHNARAMALIQQLDPDLAKDVIDAADPSPALALKIHESLNAGELVGIMADRARGQSASREKPFLGTLASFPVSLWQLASVTKAPVVACFGFYLGGNRYALHFELIAEHTVCARRDRDRAIDEAMTLYCQRLEHYARRHPFNWFNFYDFWQDDTAVDH